MAKKNLTTFYNIKLTNQFLDKNTCNELCEEIQHSPDKKQTFVASINKKGMLDYDLHPDIRKSFQIKISNSLEKKVIDLLKNQLKPELAAFFNIPLTGIESYKFLSYESGHYFKAHLDEILDIEEAEQRKISVVIFLNDHDSNEGAGFGGGDLILYNLLKEAPEKGFLIPIKTGTMVAFKSHLLHEVTPIEWGVRNTMVLWFK